MIRVDIPEFILEVNLGGERFMCQAETVDDQRKFFFLIPEEKEADLRKQLLAGIEIDTVEGGKEHREAVFPLADTHNMSAAEAAQFIKQLPSLELLQSARAGEMAHPRYQGGRKGVLDLIDSRIAELQRQS